MLLLLYLPYKAFLGEHNITAAIQTIEDFQNCRWLQKKKPICHHLVDLCCNWYVRHMIAGLSGSTGKLLWPRFIARRTSDCHAVSSKIFHDSFLMPTANLHTPAVTNVGNLGRRNVRQRITIICPIKAIPLLLLPAINEEEKTLSCIRTCPYLPSSVVGPPKHFKDDWQRICPWCRAAWYQIAGLLEKWSEEWSLAKMWVA